MQWVLQYLQIGFWGDPMPQDVLTVSQINGYIQTLIDKDTILSSVAVMGEISNYKVYPSGHHYFTLKDDQASLRCVMFRSSAARLRFVPSNGMQVLVVGKISVYLRDGAYQLNCTGMMPNGVGDLHIAFEQLKEKLSAQGLFDSAHKKCLPQYPKTIGIITSPAGAAIHDMLRILNKRYPLCKVCILPVRVQGIEAPTEIADAIDLANALKLADLLIVGRGGGSMEDLWAFNSELVAQAIYRSEIPIISAVGHEPDVTISDYVADLRAATPSNAAELAVLDQDALRQNMDSMLMSMTSCVQRHIHNSYDRLQSLKDRSALKNYDQYLESKRSVLNQLLPRLVSAQNQCISENQRVFIEYASKLDALSPLKVLLRGYAITKSEDGHVLRSVKQLKPQEQIEIQLSDGKAIAKVISVEECSL